MAYILSKVGQSFNVPVHIYEADTEEDMNSIDIQSIPMGSKCHIINDDKWYMLNSDGKWKAMPKQVQPDLPNNEKFIVTFSGNDSSYVCDKTMNEIIDAYENGQDISARFTGDVESPNGTLHESLFLSLTMYDPGMYIEFTSDVYIYGLHSIVAFIDGTGFCSVSYNTALDDSLTNNGKAADAKAVGDALAMKQDTLIQSGAAIGQIAKITAVDDSGKPTAWEAVDLPSGGGGDIALGITGASVGQIAKITAVDDTGKPTAWEAVTPETWNFVMADGTTVTKKVYADANE